ncbi:translation initiation factor IF-2-like [Panicum virgatum]|uniref:translation initiation factor IF-2-like n=1 Tax=Panicum virgatum TaxID=38727 RepID=UPI0019D4FE2B|nr:translation initiation factor IF-2-like [Panicum virgatum]
MPAAASTNRSPVARRRPPALPRPVSHHRPAPLRPVSRRQAPARSPGCARGTGSPCRRPPAPPRLGAMVSAAAASGVVRCSPASVRRRSAQAGGKEPLEEPRKEPSQTGPQTELVQKVLQRDPINYPF